MGDNKKDFGALLAMLLVALAAAASSPTTAAPRMAAQASPPPQAAGASAPVRIATNVDRFYAEPMETLLRRAYASLGLSVEFVSLPLLRSLAEMRSGRMDAASLRSDGFFELNPDMHKVAVPLMTIEVYAFARPPCPDVLEPSSLRGHRVSYQRGSAVLEQIAPPEARLAVNTPADALLNVVNGVSDYALLHGTPALAGLLHQQPLQRVCGIARPLASVPLYHALGPRVAGRQAALEKTLAGMQERGEIDAAWQAFERTVASARPRVQLQPGRSMLVRPATAPSTAAPGSAPARPPQ
ncbi:MAG: hypothetical protein DI603_21870 [Roseateles depolymerans]|uniref:Solute-binding protein family 3/N-terminal domain-containing protein n=1 Tax=Roseateles depolymerans TaxID=76731 RepID=A0A2W5DCG0_9BURK|nr:MAG: hypothetical protein DI603_21870 [Roseateles depolymerans]